MANQNPSLKQFQELRESYRNLEKLVWGIQNDFHNFKEKTGKSSGAMPKGRIRTSAQWAQAIGVILAVVVSIYVLIAEHRTEDFNLRVDKRIDDKLVPVDSKLENVLQKISIVEGEIKGFLAQKSIEDSKKYASEGKTALAVEAAQQATTILASATANKLPAPPSYFVDTIEFINGVAKVSPSPELSGKLQDARLSLAEYRSALLVGHVIYTQKITVAPMEHALRVNGNARMEGGYFDASKVTGDFITSDKPVTLADKIWFHGTIFSGGIQTLDGIHWSNVIFIGTHIRYSGGQLDLDHVTFMGCTFEAPDSERGAKFAEYAALLLPQLLVS